MEKQTITSHNNKISNFDTEDLHLLLELILHINRDDIYQGLKNLFPLFS